MDTLPHNILTLAGTSYRLINDAWSTLDNDRKRAVHNWIIDADLALRREEKLVKKTAEYSIYQRGDERRG